MVINFYNNYNNGDVHFSRKLIFLIKELYPNCEYNFLHKNKKPILKDLEFLKEKDLDQNCHQHESVIFYNDCLYINTWYGQNNSTFINRGGGCTLVTTKLIIENIFNVLNKTLHVDEESIYPTIDFDNIKKPSLVGGFKILICNNNAISGQANNINLDTMIEFISEMFPHITFYVTNKFTTNKKNIVFTYDITNTSPDLIEISYISTKCNIIIGRSSGPYSFSLLYENIMDKNKTFFALCNNYLEGIWDTNHLKCKYYHDSSNDIDKITNTLIQIINDYN